MKFGKIQGLGMRMEALFPSIWEIRYRLAAFVLLFLLFFTINQQILKSPETLRRMLKAFPLGNIAYSDVVIHAFPPEVEIKDAMLVHPERYDVVLRFDKLAIRPELWRLLSGKAAVRVTAQAGKGSAALSVATNSFFDFSNTSFALNMENMPLHSLGFLEQLDPDIDGAVNAQVKGVAELPLSRGLDLTAAGRVTLASVRNGLDALVFERFRDGVLHFDIAVSGRTATIRRMDFTSQSCSTALSGRVLINWSNPANSELDLTAEIKARPEDVIPMLLMANNVRQRLEQGQALPLALKGTFGDVQMKPVL